MHEQIPTGFAADGGHGGPSSSAAMMAEAARILGVTDTPPAAVDSRQAAATVLVTVAGPNSRKVIQVASDIPAGRLARSLGAAVGVTVVARLSVRGGDVIHPVQTLSEVGVRAGSVILVDEPGAPGLSHHTPPAPAGHERYWTTPPPAQRRPRNTGGRTSRQRAVLTAATATAVAVVAFLLGGVLTGRDSSTTPSPAVNRLASEAVTAWMANRPFAGPRLVGVPADLGRTGGPAQAASVEPAGSSTSDGIVSQQSIVAPASGTPYGLTVVIYNGKVACPSPSPASPSLRPNLAARGRPYRRPAPSSPRPPDTQPRRGRRRHTPRQGLLPLRRKRPRPLRPLSPLRSTPAAPAPPGLAAERRREQTAVVAADQTATQPQVTVESVYDVVFNAAGRPLAWVPADYLTGQT